MASIRLNWAASVGATSGNYRIRYWLSTTPGNVQVIEPVTGTNYTITDLVDSVLYNGTIESRCVDGSYSTPINWSVSTSVTGGGGLTTAIVGTTTASCQSGFSGTITIASGDTKKVRLSTVYVSGPGPYSGSTVSINNSITGAVVASVSSPASFLYTAVATDSAVTLTTGTYTYSISPTNCFYGSGQSTMSLVNP